MRLDCNDWNAEFVPAKGITLNVTESSEENTRVDAGGGYGGRVRLPGGFCYCMSISDVGSWLSTVVGIRVRHCQLVPSWAQALHNASCFDFESKNRSDFAISQSRF